MSHFLRSSTALYFAALLVTCASLVAAQTTIWKQLDSRAVADFAFHPNGMIFGALSNIDTQGPGVLRSTDDGATWHVILEAKVQRLEVSVAGDVYAMDYDTLYRSTDNGDHWEVLSTPFLGPSIHATAFRADAIGRLYLGVGSPASIYLSTDAGRTWSAHPARPRRNGAVYDILPLGNTVYAATDNELLQSNNLMGSWVAKRLPGARAPYAIAALRRTQAGEIIAASMGGHVWSYGKVNARAQVRRWTHRAVPVVGLDGFTLDLQGGLYWGRNGVLRSVDHGLTWSPMNSGTTYRSLSTTALGTNPRGDLFLSNWDGIFVSPASALADAQPLLGEPRNETLPTTTLLRQNFPNPFNPTTSIEIDLAEDATVFLMVYDALGRAVSTLSENEPMEAGTTLVEFDASTLPSGVYFCRLTASPISANHSSTPSFIQTRKMLLLR